VPFTADDWAGSNPECFLVIGPSVIPFDGSGSLNVQVRDTNGNLVLGGVNVDGNGEITLSSVVPYAGTATITGVVNADQRNASKFD
jgi:hypothetical protein